MPVNPLKLAVVAGLLLAFWHSCWAALVYFGLAQRLIDFVFWIHFIVPPYQVDAFDHQRAFILVIVSFTIGLIIGGVGGMIWNLFQRGPAERN